MSSPSEVAPPLNLDDLDEGIRLLVRQLISCGFHPYAAGSGTTPGRDAPTPHVFMRTRSHQLLAEADRLYALVRHLTDTRFREPIVSASYDPRTGEAVLFLFGRLA